MASVSGLAGILPACSFVASDTNLLSRAGEAAKGDGRVDTTDRSAHIPRRQPAFKDPRIVRQPPVTTHRFASFDGVEIAWHEMGEGRPVVLIHGYFSDAATNWIKYGHAEKVAALGRRGRWQILDLSLHACSVSQPSASSRIGQWRHHSSMHFMRCLVVPPPCIQTPGLRWRVNFFFTRKVELFPSYQFFIKP